MASNAAAAAAAALVQGRLCGLVGKCGVSVSTQVRKVVSGALTWVRNLLGWRNRGKQHPKPLHAQPLECHSARRVDSLPSWPNRGGNADKARGWLHPMIVAAMGPRSSRHPADQSGQDEQCFQPAWHWCQHPQATHEFIDSVSHRQPVFLQRVSCRCPDLAPCRSGNNLSIRGFTGSLGKDYRSPQARASPVGQEDVAPKRTHDGPGNGQAETRSFNRRTLTSKPAKWPERFLLEIIRNTWSIIVDVNLYAVVVCWAALGVLLLLIGIKALGG